MLFLIGVLSFGELMWVLYRWLLVNSAKTPKGPDKPEATEIEIQEEFRPKVD